MKHGNGTPIMTQLSKEHSSLHFYHYSVCICTISKRVSSKTPVYYKCTAEMIWGELGSATTSQQPYSSRHSVRESSLVSRSWWARWQMGLKLSLSTSVPECSWWSRNLLQPPDCFWYVSNSLPKVFPCSNYYVNKLIIHEGGLLLQVKATSTAAYGIPKLTFFCVHNFLQMILLIR